MAHAVIRKIVADVHGTQYYAVIADESTDISGKQQLSVTLRWVDDVFSVHEDFVGVYEMDAADADAISKMIQDALLRLGLPLTFLRGQGYDGAWVMSGNTNGVSARIMQLEKRAVYVHCCAHSLSLTLQDSSRSCPAVRDALDFVREVVNFVQASPKRTRVFQQLKFESNDESSPGLRPLCPTRWTVRSRSINTFHPPQLQSTRRCTV